MAKGPLDAATLEHMADGTSERAVPAGEVVAAQDALATEVRIGGFPRSCIDSRLNYNGAALFVDVVCRRDLLAKRTWGYLTWGCGATSYSCSSTASHALSVTFLLSRVMAVAHGDHPSIEPGGEQPETCSGCYVGRIVVSPHLNVPKQNQVANPMNSFPPTSPLGTFVSAPVADQIKPSVSFFSWCLALFA